VARNYTALASRVKFSDAEYHPFSIVYLSHRRKLNSEILYLVDHGAAWKSNCSDGLLNGSIRAAAGHPLQEKYQTSQDGAGLVTPAISDIVQMHRGKNERIV
jgi:hypothetical protein